MTFGSLSNFASAVSKSAGNIGQLCDIIKNSHELLSRNASMLDNLFDSYEIPNYSVVHAAILRAKLLSLSALDKEVLINQVRAFFEQCNPNHMLKVPSLVQCISHEFTNNMISWEIPIRGISILLVGIKRLQPTADHLTALHPDVCQLALAAKMFDPVLPVLNHDVLDVDRTTSALDLRDYLLYFYYGGMIYGALKQWDRALQFFELCLISPPFSLLSIVVEALKKVILVSLIIKGKYTTSGGAQTSQFSPTKPLKRYCQPYLTLSSLFENNAAELPAFVERNRDVFVSDRNFGLVKQLFNIKVKFLIKNLTKAFITMSLADVAYRVELSSAEEAEAYLVEMIEAKTIFARIDKQNGTVYFLDDPENYCSLQMLLKLNDKTNECIRLEKHLTQVSNQLMQTPSHVRRTLEMEHLANFTKHDQN